MDIGSLTPRLVLERRAGILLPQDSDAMEPERIGLLYPGRQRPDQVFIQEDGAFWVSLTLTDRAADKETLRTKLCQYRRLLVKRSRGVGIGGIGYVDHVLSGEKVHYLPIRTSGAIGDTCQLLFLYPIRGREMIGSVCWSDGERYAKTALSRKIIGSVLDLTGTWEYRIRSEELYEKIRQYYRDH